MFGILSDMKLFSALLLALLAACGCTRDEEVRVQLRGGTLTVRYLTDGRVLMRGVAAFAFEGRVVL